MALDAVRENAINPATAEDLNVILIKDQGDVFVYRDECPHEHHPLSVGELEQGVIICRMHLWEFEIRTGQHITRVPMAERNLVHYPVRIVDGKVEIDVASPRRWGEE
jgi:nitrite reductase/ring-hydroxylating ferredoxin subunit